MADDVTTQTAALASVAASLVFAFVELGNTLAKVQVMTSAQTNMAVAVSGSVTVVKASKGILSHVIVTTEGAVAMTIHDHASLASGTVVGVIPAFSPAGSIFTYGNGIPCLLGITVSGNASNPAVTVAYA